jgi:hypothetical protein
MHYLLDKVPQTEAKDSIVIGGNSISIAGIESIDQIQITFEEMKRYDLDFLTPIDATQQEVDVWKDERKKREATERQRKSRAKRSKAYIAELTAKCDAEARRAADAVEEGRKALQEFDQLSDRDRAIVLMACDKRRATTFEIIAHARTLDAFLRRVHPRVPLHFPRYRSEVVVKGLRKVIHRSLNRLEEKGWLDLADSGFWKHPMTCATPTAKARLMMEQRDSVTRHTLEKCHGATEIIEEIGFGDVTLSKKVTNEKSEKTCSEKAAFHPDPVPTPSNIVPIKRKEVI